MSEFGQRLRELRRHRGFTLRGLAERTSVDFTYLSKIENDRVPYTPAANTIRALAEALETDAIELLTLANKLPKELKSLGANVNARRFYQRAEKIAAPEDWDALLEILEERQTARRKRRKGSE